MPRAKFSNLLSATHTIGQVAKDREIDIVSPQMLSVSDMPACLAHSHGRETTIRPLSVSEVIRQINNVEVALWERGTGSKGYRTWWATPNWTDGSETSGADRQSGIAAATNVPIAHFFDLKKKKNSWAKKSSMISSRAGVNVGLRHH